MKSIRYMVNRTVLCLGLLSAAFNTSAFERGRVISYELVESNSLAEMQNLLQGQGLPPDAYGCRYGVDVYRVLYETITPLGDSTAASGAIMVPTGLFCKAPLAAYCHGTVLDRYTVPSFLSYEAAIGKLFSCRGLVVAMPDYLGLGLGTGLHPYVHARSEASATVDMLRATRHLQDLLSYALNDQLFLFGYSQGGHACMATHREIELNHANEFTVTASAPMSGPYDISGVQAQYLINDEPYSSPAYLPYVVFAYREYYPDLFDTVQYIFAPPYDQTLPPFFDGTHSFGNANAACHPIPNQMIYPAVFQEFLNNPDHPFRVALRDNDVYDWLPQAPIRMYYCMGDEQVHFENALVAEAAFQAMGATNVQAILLSETEDHSGCVPLALLSGNSFFNQFVDLDNGMQVQLSAVTDPIQLTVGINTQVTGSQGPYTYTWPGHETESGPSIWTAAFEPYTVVVTDAFGCQSSAFIDVSIYIGVNEESANFISTYPNPTTEALVVKHSLASALPYSLTDLSGRTLLTGHVEANGKVDVSHLPQGTYFIKIETSGTNTIRRFVRQ